MLLLSLITGLVQPDPGEPWSSVVLLAAPYLALIPLALNAWTGYTNPRFAWRGCQAVVVLSLVAICLAAREAYTFEPQVNDDAIFSFAFTSPREAFWSTLLFTDLPPIALGLILFLASLLVRFLGRDPPVADTRSES